MIKTIHTNCAGGIIINNNKEIAIVNQNNDSWSLPKGHIDPGETKLDAAIREINEETGINNLKYIKSIGSYGRYRIGLDGGNDKSEYKMIYMFFFFSNQKELAPNDPNNPEAKWVNYSKVEDFLTHPDDKKFYRYLIHSLVDSI